jgi:amino acid transporter
MDAEHVPELRRTLGLRDLVTMQILLVVGVSWGGIAARQGSGHVVLWLLGAALMFLPVAAVIQYCVRIWPLEGGVYQWVKHGISPFAGFMSAWNFGAWALLNVSNLGIQMAVGCAYVLGPQASWLTNSKWVIAIINVVAFGLILVVSIPGFLVGRWVARMGTSVALSIIALLVVLLFVHPGATAGHPHVSPQPAFELTFPALTLLSLNLFSKLAFMGFAGLEQVAVFAGETRDPARSIWRSAWIAGPTIALLYVLLTGSMLTYTAADKIDLAAPVPQLLAAALSSGSGTEQWVDWGSVLGRVAILALAITQVAQIAVLIAETSRLPMVAAWDHLFPVWFTRLHPRFRTPVNSLVVIVGIAVLFSLVTSAGAGTQEAFQLANTSSNTCFSVYYLLMFLVPLVIGARRYWKGGPRPGAIVRVACVCGIGITLLTTVFNVFPIIDVPSPWMFGLKVAATAMLINWVGAMVYWRGARRAALTA